MAESWLPNLTFSTSVNSIRAKSARCSICCSVIFITTLFYHFSHLNTSVEIQSQEIVESARNEKIEEKTREAADVWRQARYGAARTKAEAATDTEAIAVPTARRRPLRPRAERIKKVRKPGRMTFPAPRSTADGRKRFRISKPYWKAPNARSAVGPAEPARTSTVLERKGGKGGRPPSVQTKPAATDQMKGSSMNLRQTASRLTGRP